MARRSKRRVKNRAPNHIAKVKRKMKMRARRKSRGYRLAAAKRKRRAAQRLNRAK